MTHDYPIFGESECSAVVWRRIIPTRIRRSLSEVQESAQFLVQDAMAKAIMESLLAKADLPHETIALINLTPYDGMLERATRSWQESNPGTNINFRSLSMTKNLSTAQFVEKTVALELLEDGVVVYFDCCALTFKQVWNHHQLTSRYNRYNPSSTHS